MRDNAKEILYPSVWTKGLSMTTTAVFLCSLICIPATLVLPHTINISGCIGIIALGICAIITSYTAILLSKAWILAVRLHGDCKGPLSNPYQLLAEKCYGSFARCVVSLCIYLELFGKAVVLLLLASSSIEIMVKSFNVHISFCYWMIILAVVLVPCCCLASPKDYWFQSILAISTTVAACVVIIIDIVLYTDNTQEVQHSHWDLLKTSKTLGTIMYVFGGHSVYLTIQTDMKKSKEFQWAVVFCNIVILLLLYPVVGTGYLYYGDNIDANILSSMPAGEMTTAVIVLIVLTLIFSIMITLNPLFQVLEHEMYVHPKVLTVKRCILRTLVIFTVTFMAESVPRFDDILIFIGGSTTAVTSFICPVLFYTKMFNKNMYYEEIKTKGLMLGMPKKDCNMVPVWMMIVNCGSAIFGLVAGFAAIGAAITSVLDPATTLEPCYFNTSMKAWNAAFR